MQWSKLTTQMLSIEGVSKRGVSPSSIPFPLSFEGEGDKGGEVD